MVIFNSYVSLPEGRCPPEPMDCFPREQRLQADGKNQRIQTVPKPVHGLDVHKLGDQKLGE